MLGLQIPAVSVCGLHIPAVSVYVWTTDPSSIRVCLDYRSQQYQSVFGIQIPGASTNSLSSIGNFLSYGGDPEILGGKVVRILKMLRKGASMHPLTLL